MATAILSVGRNAVWRRQVPYRMLRYQRRKVALTADQLGEHIENHNSSSEASSSSVGPSKEGWLFIDSVFPVQFGAWDVRSYIGLFQEEDLLGNAQQILKSVKTHGFEVLSVEPRMKDGGIFAKFRYSAVGNEHALDDILRDINNESSNRGGFPSWLHMTHGNAWAVRGLPWREDLHRFASPILRVSFEGPDIREEDLYDVLRPYGRIMDLSPPTPAAAGNLRYSTVSFRRVSSAATAHNCVHGLSIKSTTSGAVTKLHTMYERPIKAHAIRDWITGHPRIVIPVVVFFIGTLTYTVFDPIRVYVAESKLLGRFDYRNYAIFQWLKKNTVERLSFTISSRPEEEIPSSETSIWKEMEDAEADVKSTLADFPNTVTFLHGPQGSGKERMINRILDESSRTVLTIDCAPIYNASSDSGVLKSLAKQTGYWPVFPFINSLNNIIDIASVGLIGQKAGLSTSIDVQVQEMLEVIGTALKGATSSERKRLDAERCDEALAAELKAEEARRQVELKFGMWHDGRLDCVAGNGIMSELGIGDELMRPEDYDVDINSTTDLVNEKGENGSGAPSKNYRSKTPSELQMLITLPIVIIKNYATKRGHDEVMRVLSNWAASLVNAQVAHVIVCSDNRENAKELAQALPSKPLHSVALSDADAKSALAYVLHKLKGGEEEIVFTTEQTLSIQRLGGRASDLETLVHKVRSGQPVEEAVEDIINRCVNELQKSAFGEDAEDAKDLPWSREQAWTVIKQLAKTDELSYHEVYLEFPFKGDETALRSLEHAEIITIGTRDGRPTTIRPGRPVYRSVFERLVADPVFQSIKDLGLNEKKISSAEATIKTCEEELLRLREIGTASSHWWSKRTPSAARAAYLMRKMQAAGITIEKLEAANVELKKILSQNK